MWRSYVSIGSPSHLVVRMPPLQVGTKLAHLAVLACWISLSSFCAAFSHNGSKNTASSHPYKDILDQANQALTSNNNEKRMVEDGADSMVVAEESSERLAPWLDRVRSCCFHQRQQSWQCVQSENKAV